MAIAFILLHVEKGQEGTTLTELLRIDGVVEVHQVYGDYDIICKVQKPTIGTIRDTVLREIRFLSSIRSTISLIVVD
ncbi:MAG: Lrp/AsnC ligand binding domain-containing protein [Candidatus Hodarchaeota archaeon]